MTFLNTQWLSGQMSVIKFQHMCVLQSKKKIKVEVTAAGYFLVLEDASGIFHLEDVVSVHSYAQETVE